MSDSQPEPKKRNPYLPAVLWLLAGMCVLYVTGLMEHLWLKEGPGGGVVLSANLEQRPDDALDAWISSLPDDAITVPDPIRDIMLETFQENTPDELPLHERFIMLDGDAVLLESWLTSGRVPTPGSYEVLAGHLARQDSFSLGAQTFEVVGRLDRRVSSLGFSYICLQEDALQAAYWEDSETAWLHPDITPLLQKEGNELDPSHFIGAPVNTQVHYTMLGFLGLFLATVGGYKGFQATYTRLAKRPQGLMNTLGETVLDNHGLFKGVHHFLYATFFFAMFNAAQNPLIGLRMTEMVRLIFSSSEGLGYVGDAYDSGNILLAAATTYMNNYVVQTLGMTLGISLFPLALGFFKTAFSLAFVGLAMAPLWVGANLGYTYHSVTMVLELEAYILASFVAVYWARACLRFFIGPDKGWPDIKRGLNLYLSCILFTGVVLAMAALYEAVTLITLH